MASRGYRRIGLYRQDAAGEWENFCDIHFRYHQRFLGSRVWFGSDKMSINEISRLMAIAEKEAIDNNFTPSYRDISEGGVGQIKPTEGNSMFRWEVEMVGPILYRGSPYSSLIVGLAGNFMDDCLQMATLIGTTDYENNDRTTLLQPGQIQWQVETRRRVSRRKANRLAG